MKKTDSVNCSNCGYEMIQYEKVCPSCGTQKNVANLPGGYDNEQYDNVIRYLEKMETSLEAIRNDVHYFKILSIISGVIVAVLLLIMFFIF